MKKWQVYVMVISIFVHLAASRAESIFDRERKVEITNKLGGGLTLTLHCKSKDDDLGVQTFAPDSSWSFKFSPAVFKTTLFFCNFKWGGESHWFDIYDDNRDGDVFLKLDNDKVYYPNALLATKPISNYFRSPDMSETVEFSIAFSTPISKTAHLKERITDWSRIRIIGHLVVVKDIENMNKLKMPSRKDIQNYS
ncbi:unnamed protein product [Brassica napus]|uniref:S-protein homolog n=1 Tax=Brassica napus TaxID=3708 RepID=A0A816HZW4_BRANA|nr:unnamed protein product [Brassica napus]